MIARPREMQLVQVMNEWLEAEEWLCDATNKGVLVTLMATRELRSALGSWKSSVPYGCRKGTADERLGIQEIQERNEKQKRGDDSEKKVFMTSKDGTGKSSAGRQAWKEKHRKGQFSNKRRKSEKKYKPPLGI